MVLKILLITLGILMISLFGAIILVVLTDEDSVRERWSRSLDDEDYFKFELPKFLRKDKDDE